MTEEVARTILITLATIAGVVWLVTATWFSRVVRASRPSPPDREWEELVEPGSSPNRVEVKGRPEELATLMAADLARHGLNGGPVKILSAEKTRVRFEILGLIAPPGYRHGNASGSCKPRTAEVDFLPGKGGASVAEIRLEPAASRWLLVAGGVVLGLGLALVVSLFSFLWFYAVPNPRSGIRGQVIQMVQCVHLLWPPWLIGLIYQRANQAYLQAVSARVTNLPYL